MGYLKGKSALMMFDKHANLKYKFGNRHFWAEGYYVTISPSRSVRCETNKPPAMRVRVEGYTKKLQTRYNKGVQANCKAKGEKYGTKGS